jgi:hypothetical protein
VLVIDVLAIDVLAIDVLARLESISTVNNRHPLIGGVYFMLTR